MAEAYAYPPHVDSKQSDELVVERPQLFIVPQRTDVDPLVDEESGRVVRPAIDLKTGRMPNGQALEVFYDRGGIGFDELRYKVARALADAAKITNI